MTRVNDVEVRRLPGGVIQLTIPTGNVPAVAQLDRGEAFMLAALIKNVARTVKP